MMTAFNGQVTFQNFDGILIASAYRLGEASVGTVPNKLARPSTEKAVFQILCCRGRIEIFLCISFQVVCLSE